MPTLLRSKLLLVAAFVIATLGACSPNIAIELFNNSGMPLTLTGCKDPISVAPSEVGVVKSIYQCADPIHFEGGGTSWTYRLWLPIHNTGETEKYYYHSHKQGFFDLTLTVRLQINADRKVFALPEDSDFPTSSDIPQPFGFPWQPVLADG